MKYYLAIDPLYQIFYLITFYLPDYEFDLPQIVHFLFFLKNTDQLSMAQKYS